MRENFVNKLVATHQITQQGKDWMTLALDPFHDYNHQVAGYPDADASHTVVQCFQWQEDISAPVAAANWDCHVYNLPQVVSRLDDTYFLDVNWLSTTEANPAVPMPTGILNIVRNAAGTSTAPSIPATPNRVVTTLPVVNEINHARGISRIIGIGFEVHNSSAEIYKQGSVTTYRMPQLGSTYQQVTLNNAGTFKAVTTGQMWREPPGTVADANMLKGTRTWNASEGVYATCFQHSVHNPMAQLESAQILFSPTSGPGAATIARASPYLTVGAAAVAPNCSGIAFLPNKTAPFHTTGAMFTGLSPETTLTVKVRVYIERAPTPSEADLAVLASPSAGYDVKALELYAAAVNMLPPAVKVGENAKGDWWRAILSVLKTAAGPIGLALNPFIPGASILGAGIQGLAGQINTSKGKSVSNQISSQVQRIADNSQAKRKKPAEKKPKEKSK